MTSSKQQLSLPASIFLGSIIIALGLYFGLSSRNAFVATSTENDVTIEQAIKKAGIKLSKIQSCIDNQETAEFVQQDEQNALAMGGQGTPFNVIITPDGTPLPLPGALPRESWNTIIDLVLEDSPDIPEIPLDDPVRQINPVDDTDHVRGNPDAVITIIEYSDIDCPFCKRLHPILSQLVQDRSEVKWVYRHFPLDSLHPDARAKAVASECVAREYDTETFWKFLDAFADM